MCLYYVSYYRAINLQALNAVSSRTRSLDLMDFSLFQISFLMLVGFCFALF